MVVTLVNRHIQSRGRNWKRYCFRDMALDDSWQSMHSKESSIFYQSTNKMIKKRGDSQKLDFTFAVFLGFFSYAESLTQKFYKNIVVEYDKVLEMLISWIFDMKSSTTPTFSLSVHFSCSIYWL